MRCPDCGGPMGHSARADYCENDCGWSGVGYPDRLYRPDNPAGGA